MTLESVGISYNQMRVLSPRLLVTSFAESRGQAKDNHMAFTPCTIT
jgi:hypothetical protein